MKFKAHITPGSEGQTCPVAINLSGYYFDKGTGSHVTITSDELIEKGDLYLTDAGIFECSVENQRELSKFRKLYATSNDKFDVLRPTEELVRTVVGKIKDMPKDMYWCELTAEEVEGNVEVI